jgi:hypothetical protein
LLSGGEVYAGPSTPSSLTGVSTHDWVRDTLETYDATGTLLDNGFVIIPGRTRLFHHIYEGAEYDGYPVFFTTDAGYHVWHLAFDKILREVEQAALLPALETLLTRLVANARAQEVELAGTDLEEAASRVTQYYEAAATVLELDVGPIGPLAQEEVDLIIAANQATVSPTTGGDPDSPYITRVIDYSLFRPRGHYTRNDDLKRFFRAMSQLGNNAFLTDEGLHLAILASRVLLVDEEAVDLWTLIYEPTAWLVGTADDYTPFEVGRAVEEAVPSGWADLTVFTGESALLAVSSALTGYRPVEINPEAASIRIMGTRWVIDSWILDQLVMDAVSQRWEASPLDIAAAFGSTWAYDTLEAMGETDYDGYEEQLAKVSARVAERAPEDWGRTVYDAWLYAIEPVWLEHGPEYPDFMQTDAWAAKAHQSGFGSYAELKHDTILYTKQAVAEGGGAEPPDPPRHWVEPEPVVFDRLAAVTALMHEGLVGRQLLGDEYVQLLTDLEEFYTWLGGIAADELAGLPISEEDNQRLSWIGSTMENYWVRTADFIADDPESGPDSQSALIADIMSSAEAGVLEVATGYVDTIFVIVPDDDGGFAVASGGVYSYYEFWNGDGSRYTDEEWRAMLEAGTQPERPDWQSVFLSGSNPSTQQFNRSGMQSGLFCRDLADMGYGFSTAARYWLAEGAPDRMDADRNGIPCETVFPEEYESFLNAAVGLPRGQRCADLDLADDAFEYEIAVAYWMLEGAPDRMDADTNGIPCETVFSRETVNRYLIGEF